MKRKEIMAGLLLILLLAAVFIPFTSQSPDGLEKVASDQGFAARENEKPAFPAPYADYRIPGISDNLSATIFGIIGALAMFCVARGIAVVLKKSLNSPSFKGGAG